MRRAIPLILASGLTVLAMIAAAPVRAQEAIPTATNTPPPAPPATSAPLRINQKQGFDDEGPPLVGPCGAVGEIKDGVPQKPDRNPHGEVFAGVGTHGYREAGGVVCMPIGDHAAVTVAIDAGRLGR